MELAINKLIGIMLILIVVMVLAFGVKKIKERATAMYAQQDPYCEQSGLTLNKFSEKLKTAIDGKKIEQAKLMYEASAECFSPEKIRMDEATKKDFLCKPNNKFELEPEQAEELESYCRKS